MHIFETSNDNDVLISSEITPINLRRLCIMRGVRAYPTFCPAFGCRLCCLKPVHNFGFKCMTL